MKRLIISFIMLMLAIPAPALAQIEVDEYGEEVLNPDVIEQVAPTKGEAPKKPTAPSSIEEKSVGAGTAASGTKKAVAPAEKKTPAVSPPTPIVVTYGPQATGREKRFVVGFVGPGFGYFNRGYGATMTMGIEGEYYFFERLSAGLRFDAATKFKSPTLLSIVPRIRYVFDLSNHPRWAMYGTAGVGVGIAVGNGSYTACDIAIPGGGFWWQWTEHLSVGADSTFHILARSSVGVGWTIAPAIRYIF